MKINKIGFNLVIHSLGSLFSFFILYLILKVYGVEKQGEYANLLAIINFVVVLGIFGFPQGFIYLINKLKISHQKLTIFSLEYVFVFFLLIFAAFLLNFHYDFHLIDEKLLKKDDAILFSLSCSSLILHGLLRGIYLTMNQGHMFAIYSILPSIVMLAFLSLGILIQYSNIHFLVLMSSIWVMVFSIFLVIMILRKKDTFEAQNIPVITLVDHGAHSFLQALFYAVQPLFAFWAIKNFGGNFIEIGYFNIGLFLLQGLLVPVTMVAPYLFDYLTKTDASSTFDFVLKNKVIFVDIIVSFLLAFFIGGFGCLFFDARYTVQIKLTQIILFSVPFNIHYRILLPLLHARGFQLYNTVFGFVRLGSFVIFSIICMILKVDRLLGLAFSWSASEIVMFLLVFKYSKIKSNQ